MTNVFDDFAAVARRLAGLPAIEVCHRSGVDTLTYGELETLSGRVAGLLLTLGAGPGTRCAILADNDARWVGAYLGVLRLGRRGRPARHRVSRAAGPHRDRQRLRRRR